MKSGIVEIPARRWSRGSDPRLLRLTANGLLDRTCGERPRASRIVDVPRLDTAIYDKAWAGGVDVCQRLGRDGAVDAPGEAAWPQIGYRGDEFGSTLGAMSKSAKEISFDPKPLKEGGGWYIVVTYPGGMQEHIPGFQSEAEAEQWLSGKGRLT